MNGTVGQTSNCTSVVFLGKEKVSNIPGDVVLGDADSKVSV